MHNITQKLNRILRGVYEVNFSYLRLLKGIFAQNWHLEASNQKISLHRPTLKLDFIGSLEEEFLIEKILQDRRQEIDRQFSASMELVRQCQLCIRVAHIFFHF